MIARAIALILISCGLGSGFGILVAQALNAVAPGYYPTVFPHAHRHGHAADVGISSGLIQGFLIGLGVGILLTLFLGWFGRLNAKTVLQSWVILAITSSLFAVLAAFLGWVIGHYLPGYYQSIFYGGLQPGFSARDVGIGLGGAQGTMVGILVGCAIIPVWLYQSWRKNKPTVSIE